MLLTASSLEGRPIQATDGEVGRSVDFLFDDAHWTVRYLVVETGRAFARDYVLVSPISIATSADDTLAVGLSVDAIEHSPPLDSDAPLSRLYEKRWYDHFGYGYYWIGGDLWGQYSDPTMLVPDNPIGTHHEAEGDKHLRSTNEVARYRIDASDGEIGHVEDFVIDNQTWTIRYLVVDAGSWLDTRRVLVSPQWATEVDFAEGSVHVDLTRDEISASRPLDAGLDIQREYEESLHQHYQRPRYWVD